MQQAKKFKQKIYKLEQLDKSKANIGVKKIIEDTWIINLVLITSRGVVIAPVNAPEQK